MRGPSSNVRSEAGQAVLMVVVAMSILLIGAIGLAIDGGQMYLQRQMAQTAADAAAQAGILSMYTGTNATSPHPFGTNSASTVCATGDQRTPCVYAADNGFGKTSSDTVTLSFPATVPGVNLSSVAIPALTVTVQRTLKTSLIRFVGAPATSTITAKATAALVKTVSPDCIYTLDPAAQNSFLASNGSNVVLNGCGINVNSKNGRAAFITGGSRVKATAFDVVGGVGINNGGSVTPAPVTGVSPAPDPFATLPAPSFGGCNHTNYNPGYGTFTLNPGVYCGGIRISNGATAKFNPGVYVVNGGALSLLGGTTITGAGVTFYLTGTNATYRSVTISNGANVTFSAPTSGTYMGVLFYQNRWIVSGNNATFAGGATMNLSGSLYFPTTTVNFSNGVKSTGDTIAIVAALVSFAGGVTLNFDPTGTKTGLFSTAVALVQ